MDAHEHPPPPPPPRPSSPPPPAPRIPAPAVQVVSRGGGFGPTFLGLTSALAAVAVVFLIGLFVGVILIGAAGAIFGGSRFDRAVTWDTYRDGTGDTIAVLPIVGVIDRPQAVFSRLCVDAILADRSVKGVVLRVDSPGGAVTPSDQIWAEVQRLRDKGLPVVASYGGVAASGGYYVSCGSDFIMAQETSITGSIGVIAQIMTFEGLMDKIGVEPVTLVASRSPSKSVANDVMRAWTEEDRAEVRSMLDAAYDVFRSRVETGRATSMTGEDAIETAADGSAFTARDALALGLVDGIGYLDDAIAEVERRAGVRTGGATVRILERRPTLFGATPLAARNPGAADLLDAERLRSFVNDLGSVRLMYLAPTR